MRSFKFKGASFCGLLEFIWDFNTLHCVVQLFISFIFIELCFVPAGSFVLMYLFSAGVSAGQSIC